jgi:hypothetical protein
MHSGFACFGGNEGQILENRSLIVSFCESAFTPLRLVNHNEQE